MSNYNSAKSISFQYMYPNPTNSTNQIGGNSGIGYSTNVLQSVGNMPVYEKYNSASVPVFCSDEMTGGGKGSSRVVRDSIRTIMNKTSLKHCQQIGGDFNAIVGYLANQLIPLGVSGLAELVAILTMYYMGHQKKMFSIFNSKQKKKGGSLPLMAESLMPLGINGLAVLASLLLIHHSFQTHNQKHKKSKSQKGGSLDLILHEFLSPKVAVPVLLVALQQLVMKSRKHKKQKGGCGCGNNETTLQNGGMMHMEHLVAPHGINNFSASLLILLVYKILMNKKSKSKSKKSQKGGYISELQTLLMPNGIHPFLSAITLLLMGVSMRKRRS